MSESTLDKRISTSGEQIIVDGKPELKYPVRFSYFKAITGEMVYDKKKKAEVRMYSSMFLIPKEDKVTVDKFKALITATAKEKWGDTLPKNLKITFRDGDKEGKGGVPDGTEPGSEPYGGHYFVSARSDRPPAVVGPDMQPITDPGKVLSGYYGRVSLNCFTFDNDNGKGVSFGLGNIQFTKEGPVLGGTTVAPDKEFTPISEAAGGDEGSSSGGDDSSGDGIFD